MFFFVIRLYGKKKQRQFFKKNQKKNNKSNAESKENGMNCENSLRE